MTTAEQKPAKRPMSSRMMKLNEDMTQGALLGSRCNECGTYFFGAPQFCVRCTLNSLKPVELSKEGKLHTYTIVRQAPPGWQGQVPYILGSVELPEGVDILTEVIDLPKENIKIGMKMEMVLKVGGKDAEGNEIMVYKWRPAP